MLRALEWTILLGLGVTIVWLVLVFIVGFTTMLGSMFSRWRAWMAVVYDKFKMEKEWTTPNLARQAAYRLDLDDYPKTYQGYGKRQADIRVCLVNAREHRCSLAATDALASWVRTTLVELEQRELDQERMRFVESLLGILADHQEILLRQGTTGPPRQASSRPPGAVPLLSEPDRVK